MSNAFGTLLKLWRQRLGFSQLNLSIQSGISTKHLSFLETGRSLPSADMVNKLAETLTLSNEDANLLLQHAGLKNNTDNDALKRNHETLQMILNKHEPYPGVVSNYSLQPLFFNHSALAMIEWLEIDITPFNNIIELIFDERGMLPYLNNWQETAITILRLLKVKSLTMKNDPLFLDNLNKTLSNPKIKNLWLSVKNFSGNTSPMIEYSIKNKGETLEWVAVLTTFGTPRNISLDEYQMEFFYPRNEKTKIFAQNNFSI